MDEVVFSKDTYFIRKKLLNFLGQKFYIYTPEWELVGFVKQKAFKLKEDIRVFSDQTCTEELLVIKARQIIDFSAAYDITDPKTGETLGALRRKGLMSTFVQDTWEVMDAQDRVYGILQEDSAILGLIRRFAANIIPQGFTFTIGSKRVASFQQNWNFFVPKLRVDFHVSPEELDRRVGLGAAVLMSAIEGRQG